MTSSEEEVLTIKKTIDPVKDLFDSFKNIKTTLSKEGIAVHWIEGGMFLSEKFREKCLESVDVYNQGFLLMKKVTPHNPIIPMEPCSKTQLTFKYNFRQNPRKQELFLHLNSSSHCESDVPKSTQEMITTVTPSAEVITKDEGTGKTLYVNSVTLKYTTTTKDMIPYNDSARQQEDAAGTLSEEAATSAESSKTILIGSATSAAALLTFVAVLVIVVLRKSKTSFHHKQV